MDGQTPSFHVYRVRYDGSDGWRQLGPLYLHRSEAVAAMRGKQKEWDALEASGKGSVFGKMQIGRLPAGRQAWPRGALGAYQRRSSTCYADYGCGLEWVTGVDGWEIPKLTVAADQWLRGLSEERGTLISQEPIRKARRACPHTPGTGDEPDEDDEDNQGE